MESDNAQDGSFALTINTDLCGDCIFCLSVCPFEALLKGGYRREVILDEEKCRLCGLCYSTCPSSLIDIAYYNVDSLTEYLQKKVEEDDAQQLTIACRGTALTPANWQEKMGIDDSPGSVFFTLPCIGRVHLNFLFNAVELGIEKISLISCEEDYCRNKDGSKVTCNRVEAAQLLFEDMGYYADMIEFDTRAPRAEIEESKCVACGTCVILCPYDAITLERHAKMDEKKCMGCGLCVANCPAMAITLEGSDFDEISREIETFGKMNVKQPKILVLGCQWSEYKYADDNEIPQEDVKFIRMPCSGRIDVLHILTALSSGIDGVLVSMCIDENCSLEYGNRIAGSKISELIKVLDELGIKDRVGTCSVHPKYLGMFENELSLFKQKIMEQSSNPIGGD